MKKYWFLISVLAMCLVAICVASTLTESQLSLEGIDALYVSVVFSNKLINTGLSESQVQTDVELKLRRNGFKVLSLQDFKESPFTPLFTVDIASIRITPNNTNQTFGFSSSIGVSLYERVRIFRNEKAVMAATWSVGHMFVNNSQGHPQYAREVVSDLVDKFLNDYLAANPKEQPTKGKVKKQDIFDKIEGSTKP